ncbi:MAG: restriction endonuclease subunit S [Spirochaetaceae bacterium]|nr:restriction endonuclease subunit S [Spirochaetaceae bacterium]
MNEWKTVRLGDIFDLQMGKTPDRKKLDYFQGSHKWISIADISKSEKYISETKEYLTDEAIASSGIKSIPRDTLIMSFKLSIGKTAITSDEMYSNEAIMAFLPNGKCETDNSFLYHLFSNKDWSEGSNKAVKGITLNKASLSEAKIPLPPLETQKHIAAVLDKCTALIAKHREMLAKYDTLIKSRFIEMFGDPVQNPMGWKKTELGNLCKDVRYGTSKPSSENGKYTYLRMNNITYEGELDLTNIKSIDISEDELPKCSVRKGDILFNRTNSIELCGKTCLYKLDETMVIAGYIIRVRVNEKLNPQYVSTFFNTKSIKKLLREMAKGAVNQANINAQEMQSIQIPVPPISLQNEYESFVQQIDKSKFAVQKSLEKAETLYKSLMQEYFG